jgi:hypothetical protein
MPSPGGNYHRTQCCSLADRRSLRARVDADERRRWLLPGKVDQKTVAASCLAFAAWILAIVNDVPQVKEFESWEQSPTLCG